MFLCLISGTTATQKSRCERVTHHTNKAAKRAVTMGTQTSQGLPEEQVNTNILICSFCPLLSAVNMIHCLKSESLKVKFDHETTMWTHVFMLNIDGKS